MAADKERRKQKPKKKRKKTKTNRNCEHENANENEIKRITKMCKMATWQTKSGTGRAREREGEMNAGKGNWNEHSTHTHTYEHAEKIAVKKPKQTPNVIDRKMLQFAHLRQEHQNQTSKPANRQTKPALRAAIRAAILAYEYQNYSSAECRVPYTTDTTSISLNAAHYLH